jgi:hypothetical protein
MDAIFHDIVVATPPTLTALGVLVQVLRNKKDQKEGQKVLADKLDDNTSKTEEIVKEVKTNGGESMKDRSDQAAIRAEKGDTFANTVDRRLTVLEESGSKRDQAISREIRKMNWILGRFVVHMGKNDLGYSELLKDEEKILMKISPEERMEFMKESLPSDPEL